jgi:hypothetical protein
MRFLDASLRWSDAAGVARLLNDDPMRLPLTDHDYDLNPDL